MTWAAYVLVAQMAPAASSPAPSPTPVAPPPAPPSASAAPSPMRAAPRPAPPAAPAAGTASVVQGELDEPDEPARAPASAAGAQPAPASAPGALPAVAPPPAAPAPMPIVMLPYAPPPAAPPRPRRHVVFEFAGGAYYHRLFSVQAYGGGGRFAIGSAGKTNAWTVGLEYLGGQTFHGLGLTMWRLGWSWDWVIDRFRVGLYPNVGHLSLERATKYDDSLEQLSLGIDLHGSFDLVPISTDGALFVRAVVSGDTTTWGPSLWLGVRLGP